MKALILNSGLGSRMGKLTLNHPKCMTQIAKDETILSRQLHILEQLGIYEVIITTGPFYEMLVDYCNNLKMHLKIIFVRNEFYKETNYIYSIYCARKYLDDDIILMHGDLVFEKEVLVNLLNCQDSCMKVSSTLDLPDKDFKATVDSCGMIKNIGIEYSNEEQVEAQPLYKLNKKEWDVWLNEIVKFCESGQIDCYAENAFNEITEKCRVYGYDMKDRLCAEIDNEIDLRNISKKLQELDNTTSIVYMCFSTDIIHGGHIKLIKKAQKLGRLIIGVLSDEVVASYKRFPLLPFEERKMLFENISGVYKVVEQKQLSYRRNLEIYKPNYVVHGDDWKIGIQKTIRDEVCRVLQSYGGKLVEYPYSKDSKYEEIDRYVRAELSMPDFRRGRLRKLLSMKGLITAMEAHSGLTGLLVENTKVEEKGGTRQFDAMWISSLCDSTAKGKPDIELVDMTSRFRTIEDICEVTSKPIIFDGDTGGITEHFVYTVRSLERMGVSMVIIEDKTGLKKNSLFGNEVAQRQASIEEFCQKITAGKNAQRTKDFMICARIESLILEQGMEDALTRAFAFTQAGADAIMIHSRKKEADEIFEFVSEFRRKDKFTPIVVVPTTFNEVREEEFKRIGVNIVIYANQFTRTGFPAMQNAAKTILKNHRAKECDEMCMPFRDIIRLIPEEL